MIDLFTASFVMLCVLIIVVANRLLEPRTVEKHLDHDFMQDIVTRVKRLELSNVNRIDVEVLLGQKIDQVDAKIETLIATDEVIMAMWPTEEKR